MLGKLVYIIFVFGVLYACDAIAPVGIIEASNPNLKLDNGILLYKKVPFTGHLQTYYVDKNLKSDIEYVEGKKEGYEKHWFKNGSISMERYYIKGLKSGIHKAWWNDTVLKFEYHFNEKGEYHGMVKEWYKTKQLYRDFNYLNGKEVGRQRLWKLNGTIKANYEVVHGERFGLIGLKKCYTVTTNSDEVK
ncbi:toxin-antitoxin system YwqK family antitoxin [Flavivirga sp. 57AJ16]|uniref:toxin-antitoxin system YwqK family antitoxin n=1 Tax=Flavivirga sp. 57AJ16 TaxID=3025307 RepID=UPI0023667505|nr:hypothetical protein [Flavivirga sp. 57AJ16]MDD7884855.1 hypothetical protein [Flavivirga sp. 57AJ16]